MQGPRHVTAKAVPRSGVDWVGYNLKITQYLRLRQRLDAELALLGGHRAAERRALLAVAGNPRISNAELARAAFARRSIRRRPSSSIWNAEA